jgi:hypothetical protein
MLMDSPFFDGLVDRGKNDRQELFSALLVIVVNQRPQFFDLSSEGRRVALVDGGSPHASALLSDGRLMMSHDDLLLRRIMIKYLPSKVK